MRFLKKFEKFIIEGNGAPAPAKPTVKPDVKPGKPETRPSKPGPIRRDKPSVEPDPKAKKKTASAEQVAERFIDLMTQGGEDIKKYVTKKDEEI
jgi:hypothetical protein